MASDTMITPDTAAERVQMTALRLWQEIGDGPMQDAVLNVAKGFDEAMRFVSDDDLRQKTINLAWVIASESYQADSVTRAMLDLPLQKDVPDAIALRGTDDLAVWRSACLLVSALKFVRLGKGLGMTEPDR